jgi:hypothetical protein
MIEDHVCLTVTRAITAEVRVLWNVREMAERARYLKSQYVKQRDTEVPRTCLALWISGMDRFAHGRA